MTRDKRFLIINPFGIGDVLFTTPAIRAIKKACPQGYIAYWCNERVAPILKNNPYIDKVIALSRGDIKKIYRRSWFDGLKKSFSLFKAIRALKCGICLDFSLDHRYSLISKFCSIRKRVGFDYKGRGRFLTDKIEIDSYEQKHVIEYYLELLKPLNIASDGADMELYNNSVVLEKARQQFKDLGIGETEVKIGIAPAGGASWGKDSGLKHWPAKNFGYLADKLIEDTAKVVVLADVSEVQVSQEMIKAMRNKPVDLSGKTDLEQLAAIIANLDLLICNDGGPLHMAKALRIKTVSIFGPVDELVYGPYPPASSDKVIKSDADCRPCYRQFKMPECIFERKCIEDIPVEKVYEAAKELINQKGEKSGE